MLMTKGDKVTCENGHVIAIAEGDVQNSPRGAEALKWIQPEPAVTDDCVCSICGGRWARIELATGRKQLCINDAWWWIDPVPVPKSENLVVVRIHRTGDQSTITFEATSRAQATMILPKGDATFLLDLGAGSVTEFKL